MAVAYSYIMKRLIVVGAAVAALAIGTWILTRGPAVAAPSKIKIEPTAARLERGKYLFEVAMDCEGCHSERDLKKFGMPVVAGRRGVGVVMPKELGLPGQINPRNITSDVETGLGAWTDGEILRAVREGVSRNGRALFPMMPYQKYAQLADEDAYALVAYLRTLPPVKNAVPPTKIDFPVNLLIQSVPKPLAGPVAAPDPSDKVAQGRYLTTIGSCIGCHTREEKGAPVAGMEFAGGFAFRFPGLEVSSANISPDTETGIGAWNEQRFVDKFRGYANFNESNLPAAVQANFTLMPWLNFRNLRDKDLSAIYAYLRTVKPIRNQVEVHPLVASGS